MNQSSLVASLTSDVSVHDSITRCNTNSLQRSLLTGHLKHSGESHAGSDAHGHDATATPTALELVAQRRDLTRSGGTKRVTDSNGSSVGVHLWGKRCAIQTKMR